MNEIHILTVNGVSYALRDERLDQEIADRQTAEENLLAEAKAHADTQTANVDARVDALANEVVINNTDRIEAEEALLTEAKAYTDTRISEVRSECQSGETALQEADSALSARLDQEIAERKNADEENLYLAIEHTDSTKNDILNEMYDIETGIRNQLEQDKASLEEADNAAAARLDALEKAYRHIATVTQDTDEEIKQIDITANSEGNAFSCSEFLIFLTLPTSDEIYNDYKTQLYIGHKMYNWEVLFRQAFSRTVQRKWRIHLRHLYNGWWAADGAHSEDTNEFAVNMLQNVGNVKSSTQAGETVSELHFLTTANIPNGTIFEIYGK